MLQRTNPGMVIDTFHEFVTLKYDEKINARDETFFLNYASAEYASDMPDIVSKIKSCWGVLTDPSKAAIWQYIYILKELSKRYKASTQ